MRALIISLLLTGSAFAQSDHYLIINPGTHKSQIYTSDIDSDGNIISGGFDKTIKVWDSKKGTLVKEFLGQIGPGSEGMIYHLDVSPDNKYLACAGWLGKDDASENIGDIRIYDYKTGKLIKLLSYHQNSSTGLKFTADSRYLISSDADGKIVKWDFLNGKPVLEYTNPNDNVESIAMGDNYFVTGHTDGMIYKWGLETTGPEKKIKFFNKVKDLNVTSYVAVSDDGQRFAVSGKELGMILVFDKKAKIQDYFFVGEGKSVALDFSPEGNRLAIAVKKGGNHRVQVYELQGEKWKEITRYNRHNDLIGCVQFISQDEVVSMGGVNNEVAVWRITSAGSTPKELFFNDGIGRSNYSAALSGTELAFSKIPDKAYGDAPYREVFNLFDRQIEPIEKVKTIFNYPVRESGQWSLYEKEPVRYSDWDPSEILYIIKNKQLKDSILRYPDDGNRFGTYSIVSDKYFVAGCDYGILEAYDFDGVLRSRFVGHEGAVRSATLSENGKFLITSGLDMTIRFWPVAEIGKGRQPQNLPSPWQYCIDMQVDETYHKIFRNLGVESAAKGTSVSDWETVLKKLRLDNWPRKFLENKYAEATSNFIYPVVSIFIANNGEWVIWNQDGYFTSSKKGARYVGYHVNQGKDKEAKFYPFDQFDLKYNRPDIIMKDMQMADAGVIDLYRKAYLKRLKRMGMTEDDLKADIHAPTTRINKYTKDGNKATLSIGAEDYKYGIDRIYVYVNDVPVFGRKGIDVSSLTERFFDRDITIDLMGGNNKVQVSVLNKNGVESFRETVNISFDDGSQSNLYIACVGVSSYANPDFNLNYAAKDAIDIAALLTESNAYQNVNTKVITDNQVTRQK